jgi:uncharacterized protein YqeY
MTTPHDRVSEAMRAALKGGERERLATLRMLLNEIDNERIRSGQPVDEPAFVRLVRRAIKQRDESADQYAKGGRDDLAAKERREIEVLAAYLPEEVGDDELRAAISQLLAAGGLSGPAAIGPLMKQMLARYGDRADGGRINRLVREQLGSGGG